MNTPRVGLTGPGGYLGRLLGRHLQVRGIPFVPLGRANGIQIEAPGALEVLPASVRTLVHMAARTGVAASWSDVEEVLRFNLLATLEAVRVARLRGLRLIILSSYPYGRAPRLPTDETQPLESMNPYGSSKLMCEQLVLDSARLHGFGALSLRLFNVYGREPEGHHTLPAQIWQQLRNGGSRVQVKDAEPRRDYLFVEDLCAALIRAIESEWQSSTAYNLGAGCNHSVRELVEAFGVLLGRELELVDLRQPRPGEIPETLCDHQRFSGAFGWAPRVSLPEGLRSYLEPPC